MDVETWVWIIFFVIIALLRLIGWIMEQARGPTGPRPPQAGQRPMRPQSPAGAGAPRQETPFQTVLRMLEEAADQAEGQQQGPASRQRPQPRPRPRPRPQPQPVLRARKVRPADAGLASHHLETSVADRQLEGEVKKRHLRSKVGERSLGGLGTADDRAAARARRDVKQVRSFWQRLEEDYTPAQRAIVLHEMIGKPKAAHMLRSRATPLH